MHTFRFMMFYRPKSTLGLIAIAAGLVICITLPTAFPPG